MTSLDQFESVKALVLGDIMLDHYVDGEVHRISPEAPVPVVTIKGEANYLGGSGNVAATMRTLGGRVQVAGILGDDAEGRQVRRMLDAAGIGSEGVREVSGISTICKTRVVAGNYQQLLRLDRDGCREAVERAVLELESAITQLVVGQDVVVLADYDKGNLPGPLAARVIAVCREQGIPCLVDPKKHDFSIYARATLLTPNVFEVGRAIGRTLGSRSAIIDAAAELRERLELDYLLVTCGPDGMLLVYADGSTHIPAEVREVADVTGAGDTVVSVLALCLARGWDIEESCRLASLAAGIAVSKPRTYVVKAAELEQTWKGQSLKILDWPSAAARVHEAQQAGQSVVFTNGCFDILHAGHLSCLERARKLGDLLVLGLNSDASVRANKGAARPAISETHRAALLAGLACVDIVVIFDEETPEALIHHLRPDVLVKGGDYNADTIVGTDFVRSLGGRVVTLPLVEGLSTTSILSAGNKRSP